MKRSLKNCRDSYWKQLLLNVVQQNIKLWVQKMLPTLYYSVRYSVESEIKIKDLIMLSMD